MSLSEWNRVFTEVRRMCAATEIDIDALRNVARGLAADGMLAAGEGNASRGAMIGEAPTGHDQGRAVVSPSPAASVPDNGLSAGEQPGGDSTARAESAGGTGRSPAPNPAPAERPYRPDWKKGSKK